MAAAVGQILSVEGRHVAALCVQRLVSRRVLRCRRYSLSLGAIPLAVAYMFECVCVRYVVVVRKRV